MKYIEFFFSYSIHVQYTMPNCKFGQLSKMLKCKCNVFIILLNKVFKNILFIKLCGFIEFFSFLNI
jgi:hypothetical protein